MVEQTDGAIDHLAHRLVHRGQAVLRVGGVTNVVETDHGDVLGDAQECVHAQMTQHAEGHRIVGAEHRIDGGLAGAEQPGRRGPPPFIGVSALLAGNQALAVHGQAVLEAAQAVSRGGDARIAGYEGAVTALRAHQILGHHRAHALVVAAHRPDRRVLDPAIHEHQRNTLASTQFRHVRGQPRRRHHHGIDLVLQQLRHQFISIATRRHHEEQQLPTGAPQLQ
ncbi:hypothetical protein D3C78_742450 [compost metagenome]